MPDPTRERSPIQVEYRRGVYLPEGDLWLDPADRKPFAFVSHAHADHVAPHAESLCSQTTKVLVEKRFGHRGELHGYEFGEAFEHGPFRGRLVPSGHILGAAQIYLEREDGESLLYTGDFKLREGVSSEVAEPLQADTLIMETTYGLPKYHLPPSEEVLARMASFAKDAQDEGVVPILGAYSLGKAQEVMLALGQRLPGQAFLLHSSSGRLTEIYGEMGYALPPWEVLTKDSDLENRILILPPSAIRSQQIRRIKNKVTAMVTGWGLDSGAKFRYQVDEVFPLSDHADYPDLIRYVELVQPKRVLTLHGFAEAFAQDLRSRGWEAWALTGPNQMELTLNPAAGSKRKKGSAEQPESAGGELAEFAQVCDAIAQTAGKTRKIQMLALYLQSLAPESCRIAAVFLTGRPFGRTQEVRALNVGWAVTRRAVLEASGRTETEYRQLTQGQNEAGRAAYLCLEGRTQPQPFSLQEVELLYQQLAQARGPVAKSTILRDALKVMHPVEVQYVIKILSGDLRIGLKEGLVEEAIAEAFQVKSALVRQAHMLVGDIGELVILASEGRLEEAAITPFVPVKSMLASPEETAQDIWERLGETGGEEQGVWLEDKYDGIRAQLHRVGDRVELFSRDLRPLHKEFQELLPPAREFPEDVILDGEIVAFAEGKKLSFFDLQKRLGRLKESDLFFGPSVPVRFVAFDLLWVGGESLMEKPLTERRARLESLQLGPPFETLAVIRAENPDEIEAAFKASRLRDNEGLIAKDPMSTYSPGRRGLSWLKLKKPMSTLDCVVVRAEEGHGKRSHVLSDYTFALRDARTDELVVIGKAYSGLTDEEIEDLTEHFKEHTVSKSRRVHEVTPNVVLEIAFDSINPSKRHNSGLALRFPRIKAIRHDKTLADIDTLDYARKLAGLKAD